MASFDELSEIVGAVGELAGLLKRDGNGYTVDTAWFEAPVDTLADMGGRLGALVALVDALLQPAAPQPPAVPTDARWYPIPNPKTGAKTAFHVVTPSPDDTSGQIGLGVLCPYTVGDVTLQAYVYAPLFGFDPRGAHPAFGGTSNPWRLGLRATTSKHFEVDDPSAPGETPITFSALNIEGDLFFAEQAPTFTLTLESLSGTSAPDTYDSLKDLERELVIACIGEVIVQGGYWLHRYIGDSPATVGDILVAAHFLGEDDKGDYHFSVEEIDRLMAETPEQIAVDFAYAALDALALIGKPLIPLPEGGVYVEAHDDGDARDYGIRFATRLAIGAEDKAASDDADAGGEAHRTGAPEVDLCLGTWMTGESDDANWMSKITGDAYDRGLSVLLLRHDTASGESTFAPRVRLCSVGLNVKGRGGRPLLDIEGYTLQGAELRGYLDSNRWPFGFVARLDEVGFPLGPDFSPGKEGGSGNLVAQTLVSSGDASYGGESEEPKPDEKKEAVNPAFSAEAGYISGHTPMIEVFDPDGEQTDMIWFPIQRRFGPVDCEKIGLKIDVGAEHMKDPVLGLVVDGGLNLQVLSIYVEQLALLLHLRKLGEISGYGIDLQGMMVTFGQGGVELSGGLLRHETDGGICYDGELLIKAEKVSLFALGSFGYVPDVGVSFFAFGMVDAPIGGPPYLQLSGISAGFGVNRSLKIPMASQVQDFPLLAGLAKPSVIGGKNALPATVLTTLEDWVRPSRYDYWLAAGVQVSSCEIIDANVLLIGQVGKDLLISGIGVGSIVQPDVGETFINAVFDIACVFRPIDANVMVSAGLSPSTFIIAPDVHLTGGCAFGAWFGEDAHDGDFVFTMGGYHPAFDAPAHYPKPAPLGLSWKVSDYIDITGGLYYAITPAATMAGGSLEVSFHASSLEAWLRARIDTVMLYRPVTLLADASVTAGISYPVDSLFVKKTLSVEVGADFHLWWPPYGGRAHAKWHIISVSADFGAPRKEVGALSWSDFEQLLPIRTPDDGANAEPTCLRVNVNEGLLETVDHEGENVWIVRPDDFTFTVGSAVPATTLTVADVRPGKDHVIDGEQVGVQRVNGGIEPADYVSEQIITITRGGNGDGVALDGFHIDPLPQKMPAAMWGTPPPDGGPIDLNPAEPTVAATVGAILRPKGADAKNHTPDMDIDEIFEDRCVNSDGTRRLPLSPARSASRGPIRSADSFADLASVDDRDHDAARDDICRALAGLGVAGWVNGPLTLMAGHPGKDFADEPLEGAVATVDDSAKAEVGP